MPLVKSKNKRKTKCNKKIKQVRVFKKRSCFKKRNYRKKIKVVISDEILPISSVEEDVSIFNVTGVNDPLIGTPREVRKELDALALKMQKHPNDNDCFNKIHFYIHKYLLGLVFKKFSFIKGYDENDMYQESLIALFKKAIPKFNPNKGMSFLNFAKMCITRHLITILHASKHRKKNIPINTAVSMDHSPINQNDNEMEMAPLSNIIADDNNKTLPYKKLSDKESFNQTFESIKSRLSSFEIVVLEEYLNEKSYKEVAKGVSKRLEIRYNAKSIDNALLRIRKKAQELIKCNSKDIVPLLFN
jgi:RNA polymerase sporulation-specific sigma factor